MTKPAAIAGTFADLKTVKTRSVVQMIIEVPIEHGEQIIAAFGFPRPGGEVPVAVARLDPEAVKHAPAASEKPKIPFCERPLSWQAAVRCQNRDFQLFLAETYLLPCDGEEDAANFVRKHCRIDSRRQLNVETGGAGQVWKALNFDYEKWAGLAADER